MLDLYKTYHERADEAEKMMDDILWDASSKVFSQYCREADINPDEFVHRVAAVHNVTILTASRVKQIKIYLDLNYKG